MGRYVEIDKYSDEGKTHYYSVFLPDYPEIKQFYIGLNEASEQIFFYKKSIKDVPYIIIDIEGTLHYENESAKSWIPKWLMFLCLKKARDAFSTGVFPLNISFQS